MTSPATLNRAALLDTLARYAPAFLYGLGVALLLRRYLAITAPALCAAAMVGLGIATVADWLFRRRYDAAYLRAWLDLTNAGGGRIMAGDHSVTVTRFPGVSGRYLAGRILYPVLFLLAAALVPAPEPARRGSNAGLFRAASAVGRDIDQAAADALLTERQSRELRNQVDRIRELAREDRTEAAAEAIASLRERLDRTLAESYDSASERLETAARLAWDLAAAEGEGNDRARRAAAEGLAELRSSLSRSETMNQAQAASSAQGLERSSDAVTGNPYHHRTETERNGGNTRHNSGNDINDILDALERHGRELSGAAAGAGTGSGSDASRNAPKGNQSGQDGRSEPGGSLAATGSGGRAAAAAERLRIATESLAALREAGTAGRAAVGTAAITGAEGRGVPSNAAGLGRDPGRDGSGRGGSDRGRGDAPLVLAGESHRGDHSLDYVPLTATGRSRFDGPELNRSRSEIGDRLEPEERRPASQSAVDAPRRLGAGASVAAPGPTRSQWVDAYFDALLNQTPLTESREGTSQ
ncbi:MAG: FUSC family protein [Planctomycetaceae bacterium]|nr:FUSC family protein [Planctomycetaceae bacterium]